MKKRILISAPYFLPVVDQFRSVLSDFELVIAPVNERLSEQELLENLDGIDGTICGDDEYTDHVLAKFPRLKVISKWGTGIDSIDQVACARRGVKVCNTPDAFTVPVAETTLGYCLDYVRKLSRLNHQMHSGEWRKQQATTLSESTVGLIGLGNIGRAVARRLRAFGARVLAYDIKPMSADAIHGLGVESVELDTILRESNIVSLHCDLNPTSRGLFDLKKMEKLAARSAALINTARGPLVREADLVEALSRQMLGAVYLDVFEKEPLPMESPLRKLPNVFMAPHNSNASPAAWARVHENTIKNLREGLGV